MDIKTILENIETLAGEDMTEDGIHHDDWPNHDGEYQSEILKRLVEVIEPEQKIDWFDEWNRENEAKLAKLTIR